MTTRVCTYDNPVTMRRECWQDGQIVRSYAMEVFCLRQRIPGRFLFFGANFGEWTTGQIVGDPWAMLTPEELTKE